MRRRNTVFLSHFLQVVLVAGAGAVSFVGLQRVISGMNHIVDVSNPMLSAVEELKSEGLRAAFESSRLLLRNLAEAESVGPHADALRAVIESEKQEFETAVANTHSHLDRYLDLAIDAQEKDYALQARRRLDEALGRYQEMIEEQSLERGSVQARIALGNEADALKESITGLLDQMINKELDETSNATAFARQNAEWATNISTSVWLLAILLTAGLGFRARRMVENLHVAQEQQRALIDEIGSTNEDLQHVEAELRGSEARYRDLLDRSIDTVWRMDREGTFTYISPAIKQVSGFDAEEIIGLSFDEFRARFLEESSAIEARDISDRRTQGSLGVDEQVFEVTGFHKDGGRYVAEVRSQPILSDDGEIVEMQGVMRDVTDRKSAEDHRAKLEMQLQQSQKLEAVGKLAGGIAHDFNNVLTVINGYGDLLLDDLKPDDPLHHGLSEMRSAGERAAKLTQQILAFSRNQILQPEVMDVGEVVAGMENMVGRLIGELIDFEVRCDPNLSKIKADVSQIEQVFLNLIVNARDAMPSGGCLHVSVKNAVLSRTDTVLGDIPAGDCVVIEVSDTGVGIDEETLSHIFEPFFTTKNAESSGLGLSTVFGIVSQSEGGVEVASQPGHGSTFRVYFPTVEASETEPTQQEPLAASTDGHETILIVEDERAIGRLLKLALENAGYTVLLAQHGAEALQVAEKQIGRIDLVVTDLVMPIMGGRELAERLSTLRPETKVLYVSGYDEDATGEGIELLGHQFLPKPFGIGDIARKIRDLLDEPLNP